MGTKSTLAYVSIVIALVGLVGTISYRQGQAMCPDEKEDPTKAGVSDLEADGPAWAVACGRSTLVTYRSSGKRPTRWEDARRTAERAGCRFEDGGRIHPATELNGPTVKFFHIGDALAAAALLKSLEAETGEQFELVYDRETTKVASMNNPAYAPGAVELFLPGT
jgi:hypothetical protein